MEVDFQCQYLYQSAGATKWTTMILQPLLDDFRMCTWSPITLKSPWSRSGRVHYLVQLQGHAEEGKKRKWEAIAAFSTNKVTELWTNTLKWNRGQKSARPGPVFFLCPPGSAASYCWHATAVWALVSWWRTGVTPLCSTEAWGGSVWAP